MSNLGKRHPRNRNRSHRCAVLGAFAIAVGLTVATVGSTTLAQDELPKAWDRGAYSVIPNVPYLTIDDREVYLDIYAPNSEGPWPVVVAFHGLGPRDAPSTYAVATDAAAQGMLVFAPTWVDGNTLPPTADNFELGKQAADCAVAFAQQLAPGLGGDPDRTAAYGFSAGYTAAMWVALDPAEGPTPGCATDASPTQVNGVVAGDGDGFLYTEIFDGAFDDDPEAMQAHGQVFVDPSVWPSDLDARFFIWTAGDGSEPRTVGDPADETGWFAQRDPTGSIRADLERLGQLEDGVITLVDAGRLMADRLASAGLEVTLDEYPGGHTTLDKVPELIGYLRAATG